MAEQQVEGRQFFLSYAGGSERPEHDRGAGDMERLFYDHTGRPAHKWHHYFPTYDEVLARYRLGMPPTGRPLRFLEIGVWKGGSLQLWRKFLGPAAIIFGIDIDQQCAALDQPDLPVRIGSQDDPDFLRSVVAEMGGVDVVLDDGSHLGKHQLMSFAVLFPMLSDDGLYLIEDTHTSYWREWEGGYQKQGTAIEIAKLLVDDMHGWYHGRKPRAYSKTKTEIASVAFYDSIIAIRKKSRGPPRHVIRPAVPGG